MAWSIMCAWGKSGGWFTVRTEYQYHIGMGRFAITFMRLDIYPILDKIAEKVRGSQPAPDSEPSVEPSGD